jgi:hypothetical protein
MLRYTKAGDIGASRSRQGRLLVEVLLQRVQAVFVETQRQ